MRTFFFLSLFLPFILKAEFYSESLPHITGMLKVSSLHQIYYAEYGNPQGLPILFIHGGPGAGTPENSYRYMDPEFYRIIIFDQRGAGKSLPKGELKENRTQDLIEDIEKLRIELKIDRWAIFGVSWGSALALLYGEAHPECCLGFLLRGVSLAEKTNLQDKFYDAKKFYPEEWEKLSKHFNAEDAQSLLNAFRERFQSSDNKKKLEDAIALMSYNNMLSSLNAKEDEVQKKLLLDPQKTLNIATFYVHYLSNSFFIEDGQIVKNIQKINHLPLTIVQGRYDMNCPPERAYRLCKVWGKECDMRLVQLAGHAQTDLKEELLKATHDLKFKLPLFTKTKGNPT